ncbi:MAG: hypothetical protein C4291_02220 [Candidatus Dadabacteria bacterium]
MELKVETNTQESIIEILKCKWTILVVTKIIDGLSRPSEIKRAIPGITTKVLNERLQRLETKGVIKRKLFSGYPLHVEYLLDAKGKRLKPVIEWMKETGIPIKSIAEVIDCKWMFGILSILNRAPMRTNQIKKYLGGISNKVLAERLRKLEQMGFIHRDVIGTMPLGVKYSLTEQGKRFASFIEIVEGSIIDSKKSEKLGFAKNEYKIFREYS